MKKILVGLVLWLASFGTGQPQQINPATQIRWPACTAGEAYQPNSNSCAPFAAGYFLGVPTLTVTGTPAAHDVAVATGPSTAVERQLTQDDILPGFAITGFSCSSCGTYETGYTVASPTNFTASYSSVPGSAQISDGTNTAVLAAPFTSGSLAYSYTRSTAGATTFTLTAVGATTQTATQGITWLPRSFGGVGAAGATGATASGTSAVLTGAAGTLASGGLAGSSVGQTYSVTTAGTQYVYLLLVTNVSNPGGGSFTTPGPTVFPMNAPAAVSFTNQYGAAVTMYLYRSTNSFVSGTSFVISVGN